MWHLSCLALQVILITWTLGWLNCLVFLNRVCQWGNPGSSCSYDFSSESGRESWRGVLIFIGSQLTEGSQVSVIVSLDECTSVKELHYHPEQLGYTAKQIIWWGMVIGRFWTWQVPSEAESKQAVHWKMEVLASHMYRGDLQCCGWFFICTLPDFPNHDVA